MRHGLDRYVGRAIAASFGVSLLFFLFLMILLDLLGNLGKYLDGAEREDIDLLWFLLQYYMHLVPISFVTIAPFVTVIACMFAVARLMAQNELQPMLFVGRSMMRILRPALLCGALVGAAMAGCWQWVVPRVATEVTEAQSLLLGGSRRILNVVQEERDGDRVVLLHARRYEPETQELVGVRLLRMTGERDGSTLVRADRAEWDRRIGDWRLYRTDRRTGIEGPGTVVDRSGERSQEFLGVPHWPPQQILQRAQDELDSDLFAYDELYELRRLRPNRRDVAMALHRHVTHPLANLVLLMLALPFAIHFERGSRIERVLGAIGVCLAYLLFDLTCQNLGLSGWVHPVVAAWSPTILFGSLGVVMFGSIRT